MNRLFYDYLKDELAKAGLEPWARHVELVMAVQCPEFLKAVARAWEQSRKAK